MFNLLFIEKLFILLVINSKNKFIDLKNYGYVNIKDKVKIGSFYFKYRNNLNNLS